MTKRCKAPDCTNELTGKQRSWCSDACKMKAQRAKNKPDSVTKRNDSVTESDIQAELAAIKTVLQEILRKLDNGPSPTSSTLKPGNFDDVDDLIEVTAAKSNGKSAQTFIENMCKLQGMSAEQTARMTGAVKPNGNGGPKEMDVPQFDVPDFEDMPEIEL